uniref:Glucosidase II subunit alpha n=1 Tax=Plectus sambesii TaxID=2011161 RepID=A0A914X4X0_9BILA
RSTFKTCEQATFCKRHRSLETGESPFTVDAGSVVYNGTALEMVLKRAGSTKLFKVTLVGLGDGRLHLVVDELTPIRPRYQPLDALTGSPKEQKFKSHTPGAASSMLMTAEGNKVVVLYRPFRVDVYSGTQELVLSINSQGLLKYEEYRERKDLGPNQGGSEGGSSWLGAVTRPFRAIASAFRSALSADDESAAADDDFADDDLMHDSVVEQDKLQADSGATGDDDDLNPAPEEAKTDDDAKGDDEKDANEEKEEEGMWEENFKRPSSVGVDISFIGFQHLYGLPEHADSFSLKSTTGTDPYRLYNLDVFEYELNNPMALYGSIPYVMAQSPTKAVGLLWLNAAETWVDVKSSTADKGMLRSLVDKFKSSNEVPQMETHWISESGLIDIYIMLGPSARDVFRQYTDLTGITPLPPMWSIAYHQCRWNYNDMEDVASVHASFDEHDIPMDVIWLDIEHTDGKRYFTWDPVKFSDPKAMIDGLAQKHRKMVTIIDPHLKKDDGYHVYKDAKDYGYFVKDRDGNDFEGHCWPGASSYLDFLNPVVRDYWAGKFSFDKYAGSTENLFTWNDMNEPSVFSGPEVTMHKDAKHFGGWEHRDVHNIYGFYHHSSTYKGQLARTDGRLRPFVLTRAFFVGSQRTTAVWTGDNTGEWSHLKASVPMLLSLSVAGIPFVGADIGGFFKNPDEELLVRWYQAAAFTPFFRAHAHIDTRRREPWLFSETALQNIRSAIRRRYALLPFWYTLFYEHTKTGLPVMRPLWLEFPQDENCYDEEREFLVGNALLVRPVMDAGATSVSLYLPGKEVMWYEWDTNKGRPGPGAVYVDTPGDKIPVFQRGGTIIPLRERVRRASALMANDPITLYIATNYHADQANGSLYLDDGATFAYTKGEYLYRAFDFKKESDVLYTISSRNLDANGKLLTDVTIEKIIVRGARFYPRDVHLYLDDYNPEPLQFTHDRESMTLTIRKPDVRIGADFRIDIHV